ncbi:hypothetical protein IMSHALPRED_002019 [Imshaugia aleurites]|uniref:Uncharacterized protein n=1 Tax=Imshaugia aleurites TaxID=172621 RepID=A0A8H3J4H1_9LECA|nr:hypothetical protein IMSHALPRED_002019 [Imshaugia aleurites]
MDEGKSSTSIKLTKGKSLASTSIRNEYEDITYVLKQEDVRRWQMAENLLIKDLPKRSDNDWQATITDRSRNWPSMDIDPKNLDWSLLLAFDASGALYGGRHVLAWNAEFGTWAQRHFHIPHYFRARIDGGAAGGESHVCCSRRENGRAWCYGGLL